MFRAIPFSSSGGQILLLQHLVSSQAAIQGTGWKRTAFRSQPLHWIAAYGEWR